MTGTPHPPRYFAAPCRSLTADLSARLKSPTGTLRCKENRSGFAMQARICVHAGTGDLRWIGSTVTNHRDFSEGERTPPGSVGAHAEAP
jgi:hypothetical protein